MTIVNGAVLLGLGGALVLVGRWGRRNAEMLAAAQAGVGRDRTRKLAVIRRGAMACDFVAAAFVVLAFISAW